MPCDSIKRNAKEQQEREDALKDLEKALVAGKLRVTKNNQGELSVDRWSDTRAAKSGWCDGCALAAIAASGSWMARRMLQEQGNVAQGRTFNTVGHGHPHKVPR